MKPTDVPLTEGLNGLNWHVQVLPLSLSMTSLPPTWPVFPPADGDAAGLPAAGVPGMGVAPPPAGVPLGAALHAPATNAIQARTETDSERRIGGTPFLSVTVRQVTFAISRRQAH